MVPVNTFRLGSRLIYFVNHIVRSRAVRQTSSLAVIGETITQLCTTFLQVFHDSCLVSWQHNTERRRRARSSIIGVPRQRGWYGYGHDPRSPPQGGVISHPPSLLAIEINNIFHSISTKC